MIAHRQMGLSLLHTGEIAGGRAHLDRAIALYDPGEHRPFATRFFGQDMGSAILCWRSLALLLLGYPDAALADTKEALKIGRDGGHSATLTYALNFSVFQHVYCGDYSAANTFIEEFNLLKDQIGSAFWGGWGLALSGCISALTGRPAEAIQSITSGVVAMRSTGNTIWAPLFLTHLAHAHAQLGQLKPAWINIYEAIRAVQATKESWYEAEINRVAGEIALLGAEADILKAEAYFAGALTISKDMNAKSLELRAATSMARLLRIQGKQGSARGILSPIYGWFTEGFDTIDLREARRLLEKLA